MQCQGVMNLLSEYMDGQLDTFQQQKIEAHLEVCDVCRLELEELQESMRLFKHLPEISPPPELRRQLFDTINEEAVQAQKRQGVFIRLARAKWSRVVAAAAIIILTTGITTLFYGSPAQWGKQDIAKDTRGEHPPGEVILMEKRLVEGLGHKENGTSDYTGELYDEREKKIQSPRVQGDSSEPSDSLASPPPQDENMRATSILMDSNGEENKEDNEELNQQELITMLKAPDGLSEKDIIDEPEILGAYLVLEVSDPDVIIKEIQKITEKYDGIVMSEDDKIVILEFMDGDKYYLALNDIIILGNVLENTVLDDNQKHNTIIINLETF